jgi:hypothetical protein
MSALTLINQTRSGGGSDIAAAEPAAAETIRNGRFRGKTDESCAETR